MQIEDGRYVRASGASSGTVEPSGCAGLTINLDALWAEVDSHG